MKSIITSSLLAWLSLGAPFAMAQDTSENLPPELADCGAIFDPVGMPSGLDGADEREFAFLTGDTPDITPPHLYKCYGAGFAVRLNPFTKVPDWVAEDVTREESEGDAERSNDFFADKDLPTGYFSQLADYKSSGFDRGHQAPAADFSADQTLMDTTFVLSNMGPQQGPCFNQGIWKDLEMAVRDLTETRGRLIVFTGPIYDGKLKTIGDVLKEKKSSSNNKSRVVVPDAFFKIVYAPADNRVMAFRISNEKHCKKSFRDAVYLTSVDAIEEVTGFDFFPRLTSRRQKLLEAQVLPAWNW